MLKILNWLVKTILYHLCMILNTKHFDIGFNYIRKVNFLAGGYQSIEINDYMIQLI